MSNFQLKLKIQIGKASSQISLLGLPNYGSPIVTLRLIYLRASDGYWVSQKCWFLAFQYETQFLTSGHELETW